MTLYQQFTTIYPNPPCNSLRLAPPCGFALNSPTQPGSPWASNASFMNRQPVGLSSKPMVPIGRSVPRTPITSIRSTALVGSRCSRKSISSWLPASKRVCPMSDSGGYALLHLLRTCLDHRLAPPAHSLCHFMRPILPHRSTAVTGSDLRR